MPTPFSSQHSFCDPSINGDIVEHTVSWLTINPVKGCPLDCAYCFRFRWHPSEQPQEVVEPSLAVSHLIKHPIFVPHETPVSVNVSSTDAMLPKVKPTTFECMRILDESGFRNIFGLITKVGVSPEDVTFLKSLKFLRVVALITYSAMPSNIEPYPVGPRLAALQLLRREGIPTILYYKPLVPGWNDSANSMQRVLEVGRKYAGAIVYGGLRLSPEIRDELTRKGIEIPYNQESFHPKLITSTVEERLMKVYNDMRLKIPLYKHTSCAVSYLFDLPNYNELYMESKTNCTPSCPIKQQSRCGVRLGVA